MSTRTPIRVLVADDDENLQELLCYALESYGLEVVGVASNGLQAVSMYESLRPDAVIMDIKMPEMDGLTALQRMRMTDPAALVMLITGCLDGSLRGVALQMGASGFLHKPFKIEQLYADLNRTFRGLMYKKTHTGPVDEHFIRYVLKQDPAQFQSSGGPEVPAEGGPAAMAPAPSRESVPSEITAYPSQPHPQSQPKPGVLDAEAISEVLSRPRPGPVIRPEDLESVRRENVELRLIVGQLLKSLDEKEREIEKLRTLLDPGVPRAQGQ